MDKSKEESKKFQPPEATSGDAAHLLATAVLSVVPGASELFQYFVTPPLEKRRQAWMEEVGRFLRDLQEKRQVNLDKLQANDDFIDTVLQATQIALRNSQQEKREALRNALLNAALPSAPEQTLQQIFLNFIDTFTVWHIKILMLFHEPALNPVLKTYEHRREFGIGLVTILEAAFPELKGNSTLYDQIWKDLYSRGLVTTDGLHGTMSGSGSLLASRTTEIGKKFVKFIQEPV